MLVGFFAGQMTLADTMVSSVGVDCVATGSDWALDARVPIELIDNFDSSLTTTNGSVLTCLRPTEITPGTDIFSLKRTAGQATVKNGAYSAGVTAANETQWYLRLKNFGDEKSWHYIGADENFDSVDISAGNRIDYWEFHVRLFYIRNFSTDTGDKIPTLCVERLAGNRMITECLVEGIEDMQIELGIDTDADGVPDQFKSKPDAAEMATAVVARVYLLVRGIHELSGYTNRKIYRLGQKSVGAKNDGFVRRVVSTTVQLRNAVLQPL